MRHLLWLLVFECVLNGTRTSTLWRLNADRTKIVAAHQEAEGSTLAMATQQYDPVSDAVFGIIASTIHLDGDVWLKRPSEDCCTNCIFNTNGTQLRNSNGYSPSGVDGVELDCGKSVNFTYYDNLVGISNRHRHPKISERQAALIFSKYKKLNMKGDFDIDALERKLKKAKKEKPKSVQLYNQIGNFWHYKGDTQRSIECFRRALSVSPHAADVLLSLARVLFTLQYLDDAIFLTRRSLEVQSSDKGAWQHYFTLGEIFKTYGHYQDAALHLRHTLELKPDFELAAAALREMETLPDDTVHFYTMVIIVCLVFGVLLVIVTNVEPLGGAAGESGVVGGGGVGSGNGIGSAGGGAGVGGVGVGHEGGQKVQRHFNKAMAMKTLRGFSLKNGRQRLK